MLATVAVRVHVTIGGALWFRLTDSLSRVGHGAVEGSVILEGETPATETSARHTCSSSIPLTVCYRITVKLESKRLIGSRTSRILFCYKKSMYFAVKRLGSILETQSHYISVTLCLVAVADCD